MLPARSPTRIASVTIALDPDPGRLLQQMRALAGQVDVALVVDNGSREPVAQVLEAGAVASRTVRLRTNEGIARGFNVGIETAASLGATHVLLLDHDSIPTPNMVAVLREALEKRVRLGDVAAVGPRIRDPRDRRELPFVQLGWLRNRHLRPRRDDPLVPCDFLISSGSLIPLEAYRRLGPFDESLFVDNVDLEWCMRARARGYALYGTGKAHLDHRLGDARFGVGRRLRLIVHSPERLYYMTRNRLLLYRRPYMPLKWKMKDSLRILAKFAATMLFVSPRREYARMTWRGLRDALRLRAGKLRQ
jgi:rhamnosyltransferase